MGACDWWIFLKLETRRSSQDSGAQVGSFQNYLISEASKAGSRITVSQIKSITNKKQRLKIKKLSRVKIKKQQLTINNNHVLTRRF